MQAYVYYVFTKNLNDFCGVKVIEFRSTRQPARVCELLDNATGFG